MAIKNITLHKLQAFCNQRNPPHVRDQVKLVVTSEENKFTLYEERIGFRDPSKWTRSDVAQFRYTSKSKEWVLHFRDRYSHWHVFEYSGPSKNIEDLIKVVDEDPTGIFWG